MVCQPSSFAGTKLAIGPKTVSRPWPSVSTKPYSLSLFFRLVQATMEKVKGELGRDKARLGELRAQLLPLGKVDMLDPK